jgi:hypothetical protein
MHLLNPSLPPTRKQLRPPLNQRRNMAGMITPSPPDYRQQIALLVLFVLRFVQLGAVVLTGFVAIYLVWWHDVLDEKAPGGLVVLILAVSLRGWFCWLGVGIVSWVSGYIPRVFFL